MEYREKDSFTDGLAKWRWRLEQTTLFIFLVLDLLLILCIGFSLLVSHLHKIKHDLQQPVPAVEIPIERNSH